MVAVSRGYLRISAQRLWRFFAQFVSIFQVLRKLQWLTRYDFKNLYCCIRFLAGPARRGIRLGSRVYLRISAQRLGRFWLNSELWICGIVYLVHRSIKHSSIRTTLLCTGMLVLAFYYILLLHQQRTAF